MPKTGSHLKPRMTRSSSPSWASTFGEGCRSLDHGRCRPAAPRRRPCACASSHAQNRRIHGSCEDKLMTNARFRLRSKDAPPSGETPFEQGLLLSGGGTAGSPAARTTLSAKVLVVGPCLCSRPGAALLNVVTCSAESPETHHCQRTFVDLRVRSRRSGRGGSEPAHLRVTQVPQLMRLDLDVG